MGKMSKRDIEQMTRETVTELLTWLLTENKKNGMPLSDDEVVAKFYASKTFDYIMKPEKDFYWKCQKELRWLIQWEYEGDWVNWKRQAF